MLASPDPGYAASSSVDTTVNTLVSEEYFVGDYPTAKGIERTSARWQTMARAALRDDLHTVHSALTAEVLGCTSDEQPVDDRITDWEQREYFEMF